VFVVDEVHACDTYMLRLLGNLLKFHAAAGGSAILLSATLPQNTRQRLVDSFADGIGDSVVITDEKNDYPLMTRVDGAVVRSISLERSRALRTICVTCVDNREDVLQELARRTEEGNCSCWIRNTVDEAIEAYESVKARIPDAVVMLFHARFVMGDRIRIEKEVLEMFGRTSSTAERRGRILIATQVVEQSLDLDFDFMVIDLAPIDLVLQRVGRLHRHSRNAEGRVYDGPDCRTQPRCLVLAPPWNDEPDESWLSSAMPGTAAVYRHHGRLWLTLKLLRERELPGDQRALVEDVYSRAAILPEALERVEDAAASKDAAERSVAGFGCLDLEAGYSRDCPVWLDERQTPTRLGDRTSTLRLIREENTEFVPWHREGAHPWENSEVSVRFWLVADAHSSWHSGGEREQRALQSMPDAGRWIIPVVMREVVGGKWLGDAKRQDGTDIQLRYDRVTGLRFEREGGDTWDSI
jgi:CRISPR-associated endonuclease/helicase Cas3